MNAVFEEDTSSAQRAVVNTPDVTLAFVNWLQQVRQGSWLHLFYKIEALQRVRLWDYGEDGGFYHWYKTQHESVCYSRHEYPASSDFYTVYYDANELPLDRPARPHFARDSRSYPLRHSRRIFTCPRCTGSGHVRCDTCGGSGRCSPCGGQGHTRSGQETKRCYACKGSGRCTGCGGAGQVSCPRCSGEGRLLEYTSEDYLWWFDVDEEPILSRVVDRFQVQGLVKKTRQKGGSVEVSEFSAAEVVRATGVLNERIRELIVLAKSRRDELERSIETRSDRVLFQDCRREYIPLSYLNMFVGNKYGQYFVAGVEQHCEVLRPPMPLSVSKGIGWLGVVGLIGLLLLILVEGASLAAGGLILLAGLLSGLGGVGLWTIIRELRQPAPGRWLIFDEEGHGAWQFAFVLAQAVSRVRTAHVSDPWFTALLEPPRPDSVKSRNSFMYALCSEQLAARHTEVIVVGNRAQEQYPQDVARLMESATRLTWIAGQRPVEELDRIIAEAIASLPIEVRQRVEVDVICDERTGPVAPEQFTLIQEQLNQERLRVLKIPVQQMCDETRCGRVADESHRSFQRLVEYSGFRTADPTRPGE